MPSTVPGSEQVSLFQVGFLLGWGVRFSKALFEVPKQSGAWKVEHADWPDWGLMTACGGGRRGHAPALGGQWKGVYLLSSYPRGRQQLLTATSGPRLVSQLPTNSE